MTEPLRWGILGTARINRALVPPLRASKRNTLAAIASRDLARAREAAAQWDVPQAYGSYDALIADPGIDVVYIPLPNDLHAEWTVRAARAGKHVLCEKPLATTREGAQAMVAACRAAKVRLGVAYHHRWNPGHRALWNELESLGTLRHMRIHWTYQAADDSNWRAHSEVGRWWGLAGVGTHCVDLVRWAMVPRCGEVVEVKSVVSRPRWKGPHDETAVVALRFASGATAEIVTSVLFDSSPRVEIYGDQGLAILDETLGPHGGGKIHWGPHGLLRELKFMPRDPYVGEIADFAAAIREGRDPEVPGEEGLRNVEILLEASP